MVHINVGPGSLGIVVTVPKIFEVFEVFAVQFSCGWTQMMLLDVSIPCVYVLLK